MKKSNLSAILLISSFFLTPLEGYGSGGGPGQFGYSWIDSDDPGGPLFEYRDISSTGNLVAGLEDDNHVGPLRIGFSFPFYENEYVEFYIQSNGLIGFDDEYIDLANQPIPLPDGYDNIIAWMWDDMYPHSGTSVYYETIGNDLIVQFVNYGECCETTPRVDAQVILSANGKIRLQYLEFLDGIDTEGATVGIENGSGTDGLEVAFNTPYLHDQLALEFAPLIRESAAWLSVDPTLLEPLAASESGSAAVTFRAIVPGGTHQATVHLFSNDPDNPDVHIPAELTVLGVPDIVVDPVDLAFGTVPGGGSRRAYFQVINDDQSSSDSLRVTGIVGTNPVFTVAPSVFVVGVGDVVDVEVTFAASAAGIETGTLTISSNDPDEPEVTVSVQGKGVDAPVIGVAPDSLFFALAAGDTAVETLTISNSGAGSLSFDIGFGRPDPGPMPVEPSRIVRDGSMVSESAGPKYGPNTAKARELSIQMDPPSPSNEGRGLDLLILTSGGCRRSMACCWITRM